MANVSILNIGKEQDFLKNLVLEKNKFSSYINIFGDYTFHITLLKREFDIFELDYMIKKNKSHSRDISITPELYSYSITGIFNFLFQIKSLCKIKYLIVKAVNEEILSNIRKSLFWTFGNKREETYFFNKEEYFCFILSTDSIVSEEIKKSINDKDYKSEEIMLLSEIFNTKMEIKNWKIENDHGDLVLKGNFNFSNEIYQVQLQLKKLDLGYKVINLYNIAYGLLLSDGTISLELTGNNKETFSLISSMIDSAIKKTLREVSIVMVGAEDNIKRRMRIYNFLLKAIKKELGGKLYLDLNKTGGGVISVLALESLSPEDLKLITRQTIMKGGRIA